MWYPGAVGAGDPLPVMTLAGRTRELLVSLARE
jgi:hypothetical protein